MSRVTNVILTFSSTECLRDAPDGSVDYALMRVINAWLVTQGYGPFGPDVDQVAGGTKHLEVPVFVAAFNHFALGAFMRMLSGLSWDEPRAVQLLVKEEDHVQFRMMPLMDQEAAPEGAGHSRGADGRPRWTGA